MAQDATPDALQQGKYEFPNIIIGIIVAVLYLAIDLGGGFLGVPALVHTSILFIVGISDLAYWFFCLYDTHIIIKQITNDKYPISASQAVLYHFIPLFNIYWMHKWPGQIADLANSINAALKKKSTGLGIILFWGCFILGKIHVSMALLVLFYVLDQLIRGLKKALKEKPLSISDYSGNYKVSKLSVSLAFMIVLGVVIAIGIPNIIFRAQQKAIRDVQKTPVVLSVPAEKQDKPKYLDYKTALDKDIAQLSNDLEANGPHQEDIYYNRGLAYAKKGEFDQALNDLGKAIELQPHFALAYFHRAMIWWREKREPDLAMHDLNSAIAIDPAKAEFLHGRGTIYFVKGDIDAAIADFTAAIERDPELKVAYVDRSSMYMVKKDYPAALKDASYLIDDLGWKSARAYYNRGLVYAYQGNLDQAEADFTKAIELEPNSPSVYYDRGVVYQHKKDYPRALDDSTKLIQLAPNDFRGYHMRGQTHYILKELELALADFNRAVSLNPRFPAVYYNRAVLYQDRKEYYLALADINKAIELNKDEPVFYQFRAAQYLYTGQYDLSWQDVKKVLSLGGQVHPQLLEDLKKVSGRQE